MSVLVKILIRPYSAAGNKISIFNQELSNLVMLGNVDVSVGWKKYDIYDFKKTFGKFL